MSAQKILLDRFGPPTSAYQVKYCELWNVITDFPWTMHITNSVTGKPWTRVLINKDFKIKLVKAFSELEKAQLHTEIKTFDGCYEARQVRGRDSTSLHAWAAAIDLNASIEKLAQHETKWSGQFIAIMKAAGLFWGGDWQGRKDNMHFALFNG